MKKYLLIILLSLSAIVNAQIQKTSCWDFNCGRIKENYYVNQKGEKNGPYKLYYEDGLLAIESNYKNGELDGIYKEYDRSFGKVFLKNIETYKDGILNGPTTRYGGRENSIVIAKGNYLNGKETGLWTYTEEDHLTLDEENVIYTKTVNYSNSAGSDNTYKLYYYPTNKLYADRKENYMIYYSPDAKKIKELNFDSSGAIIESKRYFLNGNLKSHKKTHFENQTNITEDTEWYENGKMKRSDYKESKGYYGKKIEQTWYESGQLKTKNTEENKTFTYEGYKENGEKDEKMLANEKEIEEKKQLKKEERESVEKEFDSLINEWNDSLKISEKKPIYYWDKLGLKKFKNNFIEFENGLNRKIKHPQPWDTTNTSFYIGLTKKIKTNTKIVAKMDSTYVELMKLDNKIKREYPMFKDIFMGKQEYVRNAFTNLSTFEYPYPKGKNFFNKADSRIDVLYSALKHETNVEKSFELAKKIDEALLKLIDLEKTDTGDIDKKLRKAKTEEEEILILGF